MTKKVRKDLDRQKPVEIIEVQAPLPWMQAEPFSTTLLMLSVGDKFRLEGRLYEVREQHPYGITVSPIETRPGGFAPSGDLVTMGEKTVITKVNYRIGGKTCLK